MMQRNISEVCPQVSASGPEFWNILYNSLLNLEYRQYTNVIAYGDDLMILVKGSNQVEVENYANIEIQNVVNWSRNNKMCFNDQKSKVMIITKKKPKNRWDIKIFLNNKELQLADMYHHWQEIYLQPIYRQDYREKHKDCSRTLHVCWNQLVIETWRSKNYIQRGNTPLSSLRSTGMDWVPKE